MGYFLSIKSLFFERIIGELLEHKRRFLSFMGIYDVQQVKSSVDFFFCPIEENDSNQIYFV